MLLLPLLPHPHRLGRHRRLPPPLRSHLEAASLVVSSPSLTGMSLNIPIAAVLTISTCGNSNASPDAPNGAEEWLNCGLTSGGWSPPHLGLGDLVTESLHADGVFAPCAPYFWAFEQHGAANGSMSYDFFAWLEGDADI